MLFARRASSAAACESSRSATATRLPISSPAKCVKSCRPAIVSSVSIVNTTYGVSYSNVGFPGATIDIINKFDPRLFGHELQRINPQIVVLAFGTNEGFNDDLDLAAYRERYLNVIGMIRKNLPMARIVVVGPADGNRVPGACIKDPMSGRCGAARRAQI